VAGAAEEGPLAEPQRADRRHGERPHDRGLGQPRCAGPGGDGQVQSRSDRQLVLEAVPPQVAVHTDSVGRIGGVVLI
jgi:hypothetical protein